MGQVHNIYSSVPIVRKSNSVMKDKKVSFLWVVVISLNESRVFILVPMSFCCSYGQLVDRRPHIQPLLSSLPQFVPFFAYVTHTLRVESIHLHAYSWLVLD